MRAWQRQVRDRYLHEGVPRNVPHLEVGKAWVRPVTRAFAKNIILKYEWLGTMRATALHYGIFFGECCAGVVCINLQGPSPSVHNAFGVRPSEVAYLSRGACVHWAPPHSNSKLVGTVCRLLRWDAPERKIVLAYADEDAGEIGTIYQACNWCYLGLGSREKQFVSPEGRAYDKRIIYDRVRTYGGTRTYWRERLAAEGWTHKYASAKHRYVCVLDKKDEALMERVRGSSQPYPKRRACVGSVDGDAPTIPGGRGRFDSDPDALQLELFA